jgi:hypothetical protein
MFGGEQSRALARGAGCGNVRGDVESTPSSGVVTECPVE